MKLRVTNRAARQIDEVLDYIAERSPQGALRVQERVQSILALLEIHAQAGQVTSRPGIRRISTAPYPYLIDYRVMGDEIIVLRFRHGARKPA